MLFEPSTSPPDNPATPKLLFRSAPEIPAQEVPWLNILSSSGSGSLLK